MSPLGLVPSVEGCSSAISACQQFEQWQFAIELLDSVPRLRVVPNVKLYQAAIRACEKGDLRLLATGLFRCVSKHLEAHTEHVHLQLH